MSDDPSGDQPSIKHDYTVELSGMELDALRSSAEHSAVKITGDDVDETVKPEDATNPNMRTLSAPTESAEEDHVEDATKSIDRESLKALTASQELAAARRDEVEGLEPVSNEDATKSIDRGALAHIINAKGAPKPFGIRKREKKGEGGKKGDGASKPLKFKKGKLPNLSKLKSLDTPSDSPTAERERPHMTSLELPDPATRPSEGKEEPSVPSLKLPSFARDEKAEAPEEAPEAEALSVKESSEVEFSLEEVSGGGEPEASEAPEAAGTEPSEPDAAAVAEGAEGAEGAAAAEVEEPVEEPEEPEVAESDSLEEPEAELEPEPEPEPTASPEEDAVSPVSEVEEVLEIREDKSSVSSEEAALTIAPDSDALDAPAARRGPPVAWIIAVVVLVIVVLIGFATRG